MNPIAFPSVKGRKEPEFNASEIRKILQELFPTRKLVLSQFTFFNQVGVSKPSGSSYRRGRRCYRSADLLPIATMIALKEQGIPNKNISSVPALIQENCQLIFDYGSDVRISGFGQSVSLNFSSETSTDKSLEHMLDTSSFDHTEKCLYWSYNVGSLAKEIKEVVSSFQSAMMTNQTNALSNVEPSANIKAA